MPIVISALGTIFKGLVWWLEELQAEIIQTTALLGSVRPSADAGVQNLQGIFEIQTDHLISARRPDLVIINKKKGTCRIVDFAVPGDHRVKMKENEKKDKYLDLARELEKQWNIKVTVIPIVIGAVGSHQRINKGTGRLGNKRTSGDHSNYNIIEIVQNMEESSGDLRRLVVIQTPIRNYRQTSVWKTRKGVR